jgi:hypothetical protein
MHHFKATELSCVRIAIRFVSSLKFLLRDMQNMSVQLEIAKKKPLDSRGEKKRRNHF